ncbi:hypothetical protein [Rhizobium rhizogenes]|uniref:hypothetical protein n=1 Tax=Rhizobium rhizogenes TaxID=359 RepID=UPI0022C354F9|nr:hypothetical protein [Rhizobium rhizogenes]MCZ7448291.1 hypothetical protein [Rhizobium rhizogenes]
MSLRYPSKTIRLTMDAQLARVSDHLNAGAADATNRSTIPPQVEYIPARSTRNFEEKFSAISRLNPELTIE